MTINAVCQYLKGQFSQATIAGQSVDVHASPAPAQLQPVLDPPRLYIVPETVNKIRRAMGGYFELHYQPMLLVLRETVGVDEATLEAFPMLIDGVCEFVTGLGLNPSGNGHQIDITDPTTGEASHIIKIGEEITTRFAYPRRVRPPTVTLLAEFRCTIWEQVAS